MKIAAEISPRMPFTEDAAFMLNTVSTPRVVPINVNTVSVVIGALTSVMTWAPIANQNK